MIMSQQFARLLMISDQPCINKIIKYTLRQICQQIGVPAALLHLTDGSSIMLKTKVTIPKNMKLSLPFVYSTISPKCVADGTCASEDNVNHDTVCPSSTFFQSTGFTSHVCVPLCFNSNPVSMITVLSKNLREFTEKQREIIATNGKRLLLILHHMLHFPELCCEWLTFEPIQNPTFSQSYERTNSHETKHIRTTPLIDLVLAKEGLDQSFSPSRLARSLPKGISLITLNRVCEFLEHNPGPVSRRMLANALGFSDITAGHYLTYLSDQKLIRKQTSFGKVGRPTLKYVLNKTVKQKFCFLN